MHSQSAVGECPEEQKEGEEMNTLKEPPFKIIIDLDRCEGIVVRENGEEITFREYIRKLVEETKGGENERTD